MKIKFLLSVAIGLVLTACEQPLETTFTYWSYMRHVDEYNTLQRTTTDRRDTSNV